MEHLEAPLSAPEPRAVSAAAYPSTRKKRIEKIHNLLCPVQRVSFRGQHDSSAGSRLNNQLAGRGPRFQCIGFRV